MLLNLLEGTVSHGRGNRGTPPKRMACEGFRIKRAIPSRLANPADQNVEDVQQRRRVVQVTLHLFQIAKPT